MATRSSTQDRGDRMVKKTYRSRPNGGATNERAQVRWYEQPEDELHEYVFQRVRAIRGKQTRRRYELCTWQAMYFNTSWAFLSALFRPGNTYGTMSRLTVNVVKSCCDTAQARIAKDKPRVFVLPNTADQALIKRASDSTDFLDGAFQAGKVYENNEEMFLDAARFDVGAVWFRVKGGQVVSEHLKVDELVVDEVNGLRGKPTEVFVDRAVPREELLAEFPEAAEDIENAVSSWRSDQYWLAQNDLVPVVYAYHSLSHEDAKDGWEAVCIPGRTLLKKERRKEYVPVTLWHWTPPVYGPFGYGIAHELEGQQQAIASIVRNITRSVHKFATPRVWVEKGSGVSKHSITNDPDGSVMDYQGAKPVFEVYPAASGDVYSFLQWLIDNCYKQLGLSQLSAQSEKPAGLDAAVAMRTYQDVETQRFAIVGQRWERLHVEQAEIILDMAADLYKEKGELTVKVPGLDFIRTIDWKDVNMAKDQYLLQAFPTSLLPKSPAGQIESIQELIQSGFMPQDVALSQLRIPNLNAWIKEKTASRDNINSLISRIRDKKKYRGPNGVADIDLCVQMAMSAWLQSDTDDEADPVVTEFLLRFLNEALELQAKKNMPPPAPPGAPPGPGAPAVGQAPAPPPAPMAPAGTGPVTAAA